jgi:hypothetical protein
MSRSKRKTPIFGFCGSRVSEKQDKKLWHRALRRGYNQVVLDEDKLLLLHPKQWGNPGGMSKDGKYYWVNFTEEYMRK